MAVDYEGFSIREYTRNLRSVEVRKCWPFSGDVTGELIQSLLPPITVPKFRWWSHELASLLTKSPVTPDDSDPAFRRKAKAKSRPCKKRSVAEIARREDERDDPEVLIGSKRKKTKDPGVLQKKKLSDSFDAKTANKINNCKEEAGEKADDGRCRIGIKERSGVMSLSRKKAGVRCLSYTGEDLFPDSPKSVSQDWDSEFQIHGILKAKRKACSVKNPDKSKIYASQSERHVRFSDNSGILSQLEKYIFSLEQCCLDMSRLSLFAAEDQSSVGDKKTVVVSNDQISHNMQMQFQPVVSEKRLSHGRSCSSSSQPASADMHCGTLLYQSPFDPFQVEWAQKSVLCRQRNVEEAILGIPLNLQGELVEANGEGCTSFDRSSLGTGSSISASAGNDLLPNNLVDFSSGKKHSTDPARPKDGVGKIPVQNERRHKYFPARLGIDETFTEKGDCGQTVHSPVPQVNPMSLHTLNLNQNLKSRDMVTNRDDLCFDNTQATVRLLGKDVSVGTSYSDLGRAGERIIAPDASVDCPFLGSHAHQSWLWRRTTLGISEKHSTTAIHKNWNRNSLCDPSKDPFPFFREPIVGLAPGGRTAVAPDSELPPTILSPCGSLVSCPSTDKDLSFHGYGLGPQLNSFTFSQQQLLPFQSNPEIAGLSCEYNNVGIGLLPDARKPSFGLPFTCTDSTRQPQPHYWPQSSFESSNLGMSYMINPAERLVSFYESKSSSSYINVGKANKRLASVEEYPLKNQKIPKLAMPGGLTSEKEFFAGQQIRKSQIYKS